VKQKTVEIPGDGSGGKKGGIKKEKTVIPNTDQILRDAEKEIREMELKNREDEGSCTC
jgi:hypothetical protein